MIGAEETLQRLWQLELRASQDLKKSKVAIVCRVSKRMVQPDAEDS